MNYVIVFLITGIFLLVAHYVIKIMIIRKDDETEEVAAPTRLPKRVRFSKKNDISPSQPESIESAEDETEELMQFMKDAMEQTVQQQPQDCSKETIPQPAPASLDPHTTGPVNLQAGGPSAVTAIHNNGMVEVANSAERVIPVGLGKHDPELKPGEIIPWESDSFEMFEQFGSF